MQTVASSTSHAPKVTHLAELRDGLARTQPEIPSKYLTDPGVQELRSRVGEVFAGRHAAERALLETVLPTFAAEGARPDDGRRVFFCLASALGGASTVEAVRLLRDLRAGMRASDSLVIGVDLRESLPELERLLADAGGANAALQRGILTLLNERFDADFDDGLLEYRVVNRGELRRVETHFVARKAHDVTIGGTTAVSLKTGNSIRTSVRCTFTRGSVEALLNGVGLELDRWTVDDTAHYAVGVCIPMHRET